MKAIVQHEYGSADVLTYGDVPKPSIGDDGVLIRVHSSSTNAADWHRMTGTPYLVRLQDGLRRPKRQSVGSDVAGVVEAVGRNVTMYQPGDEVFGNASGAYAEYAVGKEKYLALKPEGVSFEAAGTVGIAGHTALQGLRDHGNVHAGQKVLINGASGGVGTFAVQIAKAFGAEVTAVCSTPNVEIARSIGADHVIDYRTEDFTKNGETYDLIIDNVGNRKISEYRRMLEPEGTYVIISGPKKNNWWGPIPKVVRSLLYFRFRKQRAVMFVASENHADLETLGELISSGQVTPVIDRRYSLAESAQAMRYLGEGHSRGKSVITVRQDEGA